MIITGGEIVITHVKTIINHSASAARTQTVPYENRQEEPYQLNAIIIDGDDLVTTDVLETVQMIIIRDNNLLHLAESRVYRTDRPINRKSKLWGFAVNSRMSGRC